MAILSMDGFLFLLRWFHFLAGITWIGMLYYFNLVQTPFFGSADPAVRSGMVRGLVPNALWWFRWGAMFTFLTGWTIVLTKFHQGFRFSDPYIKLILTGGLMGSLMWFNVWFVIWPAQQIVIASAEAVASGGQADPQAAPRGARAGLASRTNTLLSIPMLFFMGAASHLTSLASPGRGLKYWILFFIIIGSIEWNALVGTGQPRQKFLGTVRGTIHAGLGLTALLYIVAGVLA
ncbi:MAG TPA: urate hydroxylase PuuD [Myxococcota bacterium]|nr:urate hydroxylase PuuD [Myxococcota bacterium]